MCHTGLLTARKLSTNLYDIALFYSKNKFEKLEHLVCFIIRIYHDSRSPERQIQNKYAVNLFKHIPIVMYSQNGVG